MKPAEKNLALAGSIIAILFPAALILWNLIAPDENSIRIVIGRELPQELALLVTIAVMILGGGLSITGTVLLGKNRVAAGVLLLISAAINFINLIAFLLLLLSGIYVLLPKRHMKITGMVLGIAGGAGALIASAVILRFILQAPDDSYIRYASWVLTKDLPPDSFNIIACSIIAASGILGIAGDLLARKHSNLGSTLMIIACLPNVYDIPFLLLLLGAILASRSDYYSVPQKAETA